MPEGSGDLTADMLDAIRWSNAFAPKAPPGRIRITQDSDISGYVITVLSAERATL